MINLPQRVEPQWIRFDRPLSNALIVLPRFNCVDRRRFLVLVSCDFSPLTAHWASEAQIKGFWRSHWTGMVFKKYAPDIKAVAVKMALEQVPLPSINDVLGQEISVQSIRRWKSLYERTHSVIVDPATYEQRGRPLKMSAEEREFLLDVINHQPSLYLDELQKALRARGVIVCEKTIHRELRERLGLTLKVARTVNPAQNPAQRARYFEEIGMMPTDYLVFTDESSVCLEMQTRRNAWAQKGHRTHRIPKIRSSRKYSLLPAVSQEGVIAVMCQEGAIIRLDFEYFLEKHLLPVMNPYPGKHSILVPDNCGIHKGKRIAQLCRDKGIRYVFLPAYSPDLNPIEKAFGTLKLHLKRNGGLTGRPSDVQVVKDYCLDVMNSKLLRGCFRNCGYW